MKTKITLLFALISFLGMGQYAKTLFETLSPEITDQNFFKTTNSIFGINTPTGALVVRFADSAGTNVQWFKTDFNQNQTPCGQTFDNLSPEMVTSVAEIEKELGALIYPNPFTDQLTIQLEKKSESRLQLFDLQGKKVLEKSLSVGEKTISLRDLEKGIYLLSIETEFGKTTWKVVKI